MQKRQPLSVLFISVLFLVIFFPPAVRAQTSDSSGWKKKSRSYAADAAIDSSTYYRWEMNKIYRRVFDSTRRSAEMVFLREQYVRHVARRNNYTAFMVFYDLVHSNYAGLNSSIAQSGFPAMNAYSSRFGMGIGNKNGRLIYDIYLFTLGFNNRSRNAGRTIKTSLFNVFQVDIGADLLKSEMISLYPFAGLSARVSNLRYEGPTQTNPNFTNISNIIISQPETFGTSTRLGYQAGMGLDLMLGGNKSHTYKTILFVKGGTNQPFKKDKYKIESYMYDPGIKQADWLVTIGFKFATKK